MAGQPKHRVIIDTDLGIDDAHAVGMALMSPDIQVEGFTTVFGNTDVEYCTRNTLYMLELLNKSHIPVYEGAAENLIREKMMKGKSVHGEEGLGNFKLPPLKTAKAKGNAIMWLVDTILANPGEIEILALGPLTNLALAAMIEPRWAKAVKRVIFMGGSIFRPGVVLPLSTANTFNDADAGKIVFHSGFPIVMVGRDVTDKAIFTVETYESMRKANTRLTRFLDAFTPFYMNFYQSRSPSLKGKGFLCHDLLVTAYLLQPDLFTTRKMYVTMETQSDLTRGQTVADLREFTTSVPQMDVCLDVDCDGLYRLYLDLITRPVD